MTLLLSSSLGLKPNCHNHPRKLSMFSAPALRNTVSQHNHNITHNPSDPNHNRNPSPNPNLQVHPQLRAQSSPYPEPHSQVHPQMGAQVTQIMKQFFPDPIARNHLILDTLRLTLALLTLSWTPYGNSDPSPSFNHKALTIRPVPQGLIPLY